MEHNTLFQDRPFQDWPLRGWQLHALLLCTVLCSGLYPAAVIGQERWFQIEVSIFSNESLPEPAEETWQPGRSSLTYPQGLQPIRSLMDILFIESLVPRLQSDTADDPANGEQADEIESADRIRREQIAATGPNPLEAGDEQFRFLDFTRQSYLQLPNTQSDFQQTNRALERSPEHRLLFHGLWRQPVENSGQAVPLFVRGGQRFGDHHELEGSVTIRFNDNRDRVAIDADLWFTEFGTMQPEGVVWQLPTTPAEFSALRPSDQENAAESSDYFPAQVYHMQQSREMRSREFHYLDHPALGLVVMVKPYEVPALNPGQAENGQLELPQTSLPQ